MLLVQRRTYFRGLSWQFPVGVVKPGADAVDVVTSEVASETGVYAVVRTDLGQRVHPITGALCRYFLCDHLSGEVRNLDPIENGANLWARLADLTRYIPATQIHDAVRTVLEIPVTDSSRPPIVAAIIVDGARVALVRRRIAEGELSWQFPAGELHPGEHPTAGAARETREEIGLDVQGEAVLGERVHPATGRTMIYVACSPLHGAARVVDTDELDAFEWCTVDELDDRVPVGVFPPVREHLVTATATLGASDPSAPERGAEDL